jgi:hypothetical protein
VHRAHRLLSESALILRTFRNGPGGRQTPGDFTRKYSRADRVPIRTALPSPQIKEAVKWLKAETRICPFCDTLIDTTEFRRGIDEATNRTNEMLQNLQRSLRSIKINIKL